MQNIDYAGESVWFKIATRVRSGTGTGTRLTHLPQAPINQDPHMQGWSSSTHLGHEVGQLPTRLRQKRLEHGVAADPELGVCPHDVGELLLLEVWGEGWHTQRCS